MTNPKTKTKSPTKEIKEIKDKDKEKEKEKDNISKKPQKNKAKVQTKEKSVNKPNISTHTRIASSTKQESKNGNLSNRDVKSAVKLSKNIKDIKKVQKKSDSTTPQIKKYNFERYRK